MTGLNNIYHAIHKRYRWIFLLSLVLMSACSSSSLLSHVGLGANNRLTSITITADSNANQQSPVALDILFIDDDTLSAMLQAMQGSNWFTQKRALMHRYGNKISVMSFEIVPLSSHTFNELPKDADQATSILLFANYIATDGQYVVELNRYQNLMLHLRKSGFEVYEQQSL